MLHIISKTSTLNDPMNQISDYINPSDTILLTQDAIYLVYQNNAQLLSFIELGVSVYALEPDVLARGMDNTQSGLVNLIDFKGFVELTTSRNKSLSW
ncbi:sulfurtransferase complex subunit TusB [Aliivibrio kagoshimensis]|uniref:sulfurtransferase complex subunit TusB n=1 Tax=Aliivibrio kagoshimensis TaxID=2910230 RepID=UPI003D12B0FD